MTLESRHTLIFCISLLLSVIFGYYKVYYLYPEENLPINKYKLYRVYKNNLVEVTTSDPIQLFDGVCHEKYKVYTANNIFVNNITVLKGGLALTEDENKYIGEHMYFYRDKDLALNDGVIKLHEDIEELYGDTFDLKNTRNIWNVGVDFFTETKDAINMFRVISNYTIDNIIYFEETDYDCRYFGFNPMIRAMTYSKNISFGVRPDYENCNKMGGWDRQIMCMTYADKHPKNMKIFTDNNDTVYKYINSVYSNKCLSILHKKYIYNKSEVVEECPQWQNIYYLALDRHYATLDRIKKIVATWQ